MDSNFFKNGIEVTSPAGSCGLLYRRFLLSAITVTLTAGATWGAWLLWKIADSGSFTALSVHEVNAHGHAQIYGWVGLFMMGFAYKILPWLCRAPLWKPVLARLSFYFMLFGVLLRVLAEAFWRLPGAVFIGLTGTAAELTAVSLFASVVSKMLRSSENPDRVAGLYIQTSILWYFVSVAFSGAHFFLTMTAPDRDTMLHQIAAWQVPLRDIQIHGFAMLMILGLSQILLPRWYGFARSPFQRGRVACILLNLAIVGEVVLFVIFRLTKLRPAAIGLEVMALMLFGTVFWLIHPWMLWQTDKVADKTLKFFQIAFLWLLVSLTMVILMPFYNLGIGVSFSHAYFGAIRHAITVGFITMTVLGFGLKVIPVFKCAHPVGKGLLTILFVLVNLGCIMRVLFQILTDTVPWAFKIVGGSSLFEVFGILLWSSCIIRLGRENPDQTAFAGALGR